MNKIEEYIDLLENITTILNKYNENSLDSLFWEMLDELHGPRILYDDEEYQSNYNICLEQYLEIEGYFKENLQNIKNTLSEVSKGNFKNVSEDFRIINENIYSDDILLDNLERIGIDYNNFYVTLNQLIDLIELNNSYESKKNMILNPVIKDLTDELIQFLTRNPELLHTMDSSLFEKLIFSVFKKFKMEVNLTKQTRDGGYDIIAFEDNNYTKNSYIIECKRYDPMKSKVGIDIVQRLYGVKMAMSVNKAFLVTSSFYTADAINFAKQHVWDIDLKDYNDIIKWLKQFWK